MVVPEAIAIACGIEIFIQRHHAECRHVARRGAIEAHKISEHAPESRADGISPLGKQSQNAGAGIFESAVVKRHRERHVGPLTRDTDVLQQSREIWIGRVVEHYKARVHRHTADIDRVTVPAEAVIGFKQGDPVSFGQKPSC